MESEEIQGHIFCCSLQGQKCVLIVVTKLFIKAQRLLHFHWTRYHLYKNQVWVSVQKVLNLNQADNH